MKSNMSASGAVWAAARASALPFKGRAKTNRCGCSESACGGIVGTFDVFCTAAEIHNKTQSRCGCSESVCKGGGVLGCGSRSPPPQTPPRQPQFRGCHNDIWLLVNSSGGEKHPNGRQYRRMHVRGNYSHLFLHAF